MPSLYFSQGIPYVIVMTMSVVMYKRLGISNTDIALYTSWLYLPWVIKPLWSPFVDITRTKRFWVVAMQFLVSFGLALVAFSVQGSAFFKWSLFLFWIMAFASATHDIAADGFYMLSLSKHEQAWWVGLRSTFYRTAMIVGSGLLVVLAGVLESKNGLPPVEIPVQASTKAPVVSTWDPAAVKLPAAGRRTARGRPAQPARDRPDRAQRRGGQGRHQPGQGLEPAARLHRRGQPRAGQDRARRNLLVGAEHLRPLRQLPDEPLSQAAEERRRRRCPWPATSA